MNAAQTQDGYDYSYVDATARIALYDDLKSAPRITEIAPDTTNEFIEKLTTTIYEQARLVGGKVPYTLIREVSENFIHAQFREIVVSILDEGNTIRFADQGPGIHEKEKAQQPGFSSAIEPMKKYIRGVGSGFPIVKDYLDDREGSIEIEDNLVSGAVITISLEHKAQEEMPSETTFSTTSSPFAQRQSKGAAPIQNQAASTSGGIPLHIPNPRPASIPLPLTDREKFFITVLSREGEMGVTDLKNITDIPASTTYNTLKKLEEMGIVDKLPGKKRALSAFGYQVAAEI